MEFYFSTPFFSEYYRLNCGLISFLFSYLFSYKNNNFLIDSGVFCVACLLEVKPIIQGTSKINVMFQPHVKQNVPNGNG